MGRPYSKAGVVAACASAVAVLSPGPVLADPARDIQATARVLTFLDNAASGRVVIGVVFDAAKPESVSEKNAIMAALGGGYAVGGLTLVGKPMDPGAIAGVRFVFVTHAAGYAAVGAEARAKHVVAVGSDFACVQSAACAIGVSTDPTVQIVVNHRAMAAAGAAFKAAFRMMIHEI